MRMDEPVSRPTRADQPLPILKGPTFTARLEQIFRGELSIHPLKGSRYKRILIPGLCGGEVQFALLSFIAQALRIRGADVTALMCDEFLPACTLRKVHHVESACTRWCYKNSRPFAAAAKLPHRWYSEFIKPDQLDQYKALAEQVPLDEISHFCHREIELGQHILRSLESFFKVGAVDLSVPGIGHKAREFLLAGLYLIEIGYGILEELKIDKVVLEDGKKTDWGVIRAVALHLGIPVDLIQISPRGSSVMLEWDRPPHPTDSMPGWSAWRDLPLTENEDAELTEYLSFRQRVPIEASTFCSWTRELSRTQLRGLIGLGDDLSPQAMIFGLFPNVGYDAGTTCVEPAFRPASDWVVQTIKFFERWPEHHLIIKIHPAEHMWPAFDPLNGIIRNSFERVPQNIHMIPANTEIPAHSLIDLVDVALVYTSTVAVEAAALGKPVVLVGGGRHAGRGITMDARTPQDYFAILDRICVGEKQINVRVELARRYAYAFFFRACLPLDYFSVHDLNVSAIHLESLVDLTPGRRQSIDLICRSILLDEIVHAPAHARYSTAASG